ncbi:MAG: Spy/CpxP family protein refolding chaperone [Saprospiraceae bacterium]
MKNLMLMLAMCLTFVTTYAQKSPEKKATKAMERLTTDLNLSVEQQEAVKAIYVENYTKRKAQKQADGEKMDKADRKAMKAELDQQIAAVLTPAQAEKFATMKADRKQGRKDKRKDKRKEKRKDKKDHKLSKNYTAEQAERKIDMSVDRMTQQLDLDEAQQVNVRAIYANYYQDLNTLNTNTANVDQDVLKEQRLALTKEMKTNIDAVLTPEQISKRKENRKSNRRSRGDRKQRIE